jgi:hypothetical protein
MDWRLPISGLSALLCVFPAAAQQPDSAESTRFFEMHIRPLFQEKCVPCHSDAKRTSGLSLESRKGIESGGNRGPVAVAGKPDESRIIQAVAYSGALKMPPTGKLSNHQIDDLKMWVQASMPWPETPLQAGRTTRNSDHWAFKPPIRPAVPDVQNKSWLLNPIDGFILARLEKEGLKPSPETDKAKLIRRLSLDLIGLPPTPAEIDEFVSDAQPDAYKRLVERLLASPHYGERWGRHWLDTARYADTNGFGLDNPRVMWRYRDWVIHALNCDMPFDEFIIEQLAGDLMPNATLDQKIATGFHRNTMINQEGGVDQEQYRIEALFDRVATTGTLFLGLTIGCAQCHNHKYDPITQREYYQLMAFFNNQEEPVIKVVSAGDVERYRRIAADFELEKLKIESELARWKAALPDAMAVWEKGLTEQARVSLPSNIQAILNIPQGKRELSDVDDLETYYKENNAEYQRLVRAKEILVETPSPRNPDQFTAMVLEERDTQRKTHVLIRGDFLKPGVEVFPDTPAVLPPLEKQSEKQPNRLDLARWLVSVNNPLTARVTMNRIWQHYFGRGLVNTSEDFGAQGEKPSHPELLDWLATEFVRQRWSLKAMHRLIVTSATYRQSSTVTLELEARDPENILLARAPRFRVEAEIVRDIALAASGLLNPEIDGPSVFPPQPPGITDLSRGNLPWIVARGKDRYRRGMYTFWKRTSPYPSLTVFDAPTADTTTVRRSRSNSPMQALTTLNDEAYVEAARALARRILRDASPDDASRLRYAFRLCLSREPDGFEQDTLTALVRKSSTVEEGWFDVARVLLNLDETITRD